ncbi:MAG: hypothetical protein CTY38_00735 [Methylotenera sp.]|uniref:ATP-binding protein n=1 Tax=Methylotenera sp. TaxID=2051956 RepID=UPI000D3FD5D2|nr:ATP-binding protein [Methylotenera sp.]PPC84604.1 MAG: hypothetical protein CTY38_00735 [Methylotenera sp.]
MASTSMRDKVPYPYISSDDIQDYMIERLLYRFRREDNPELNFKIERVYKERYGVSMLPIDSSHVENICLHGTPGVGKTSAVRAAAKEVADMLGMKLVSNPVPPYTPQPNDIVLTTLEMSGEVSNIIMGGIPVSDQLGVNDPIKFMNKLPLYQLAIMGKATAGLLLLDDFVNAAPSVQNSALSIALEGRFQMLDLGNTYVALTANLGSLDNSDVVPLSDPMTARIGHFYVEDNVIDFSNRMKDKFKDAIGDAGVVAFLQQDSSHFMYDVDSEQRAGKNGLRTPFPCSRSWEKLINETRLMMNRVSNRSTKDISVADISRTAQAYVGPHAAKAFSAYAYAMMTGAEPIAKNLILNDNFSVEDFEKRYGKEENRGLNTEQQNFGYQLAFCLANHAATQISAGNIAEAEVMKRYNKALFMLDDPAITLSVSEFGGKLARLKPEWTIKGEFGNHLNDEASHRITGALVASGKMHEDLLKATAHALLGAKGNGTYASSARPGRSRSKAPSA